MQYLNSLYQPYISAPLRKWELIQMLDLELSQLDVRGDPETPTELLLVEIDRTPLAETVAMCRKFSGMRISCPKEMCWWTDEKTALSTCNLFAQRHICCITERKGVKDAYHVPNSHIEWLFWEGSPKARILLGRFLGIFMSNIFVLFWWS